MEADNYPGGDIVRGAALEIDRLRRGDVMSARAGRIYRCPHCSQLAVAPDDELDRLRAQVERDRPIIEAVEAWPNEFGMPPALRNALVRRTDASAPDEVNDARP
jgi:hypothetical protein